MRSSVKLQEGCSRWLVGFWYDVMEGRNHQARPSIINGDFNLDGDVGQVSGCQFRTRDMAVRFVTNSGETNDRDLVTSVLHMDLESGSHFTLLWTYDRRLGALVEWLIPPPNEVLFRLSWR